MKIDNAKKPVHGENVFLVSRTTYELLFGRRDATELEMPSLERQGLVRDRARRIQGVWHELENSQPSGTPSSIRNSIVR